MNKDLPQGRINTSGDFLRALESKRSSPYPTTVRSSLTGQRINAAGEFLRALEDKRK